jgi:L-methionine (R)-S-oxide reductase
MPRKRNGAKPVRDGPPPVTQKERTRPAPFEPILKKVEEIVASRGGAESKLLEICWLLNQRFPHYSWVGFYLTSGDRMLRLGPFIGEPTEHTQIPFGRGICGQAAERRETFVVQDVSKETNYLSCSARVRSEIVIPIIRDGKVHGELDIDSQELAPFTKMDREFLEKVCETVAKLI